MIPQAKCLARTVRFLTIVEKLENIKINGEYFDEAFFAHKEDVDCRGGPACWDGNAFTLLWQLPFMTASLDRVNARDGQTKSAWTL